jgi:hypothetical protein
MSNYGPATTVFPASTPPGISPDVLAQIQKAVAPDAAVAT